MITNGVMQRERNVIMENRAKEMTIISFVLQGFLWLLGILTLLFNLFGLWGAWHLAGFGFIFYSPVPIVYVILTIALSFFKKEKRLVIMNSVSFAVSIVLIPLTVFVFCKWFW